MLVKLTGVLEDGSPRQAGVLVNPRTALSFPRGADVSLVVAIVTAGGIPVVLASSDELRLTLRKRPTEGARLVRLADSFAGNAGTFTIYPEDTRKLAAGFFSYDVWLTRAGKRDAVIPLSPLNLLEADSALLYDESARPIPAGELAIIYRSTTISYDDDPNLAGAPDVLKTAQEGSFYHQTGAGALWRKATPGTNTWVQVGGTTPTPFAISSFSVASPVREVGASVALPAFTAGYTASPTAALLTDSEGSLAKDVNATPTAFTSNGTFAKTANNAQVTFTLSANRGLDSDIATTALLWRPRTFWGVGGAALLTEAQIEALAGNHLASSFATTFSVNASGPSDYAWYCFPQSYDPTDAAIFQVGMFPGGFQKVGAVSVTNVNGVTQSYACWRSDFPALGSITVQVY